MSRLSFLGAYLVSIEMPHVLRDPENVVDMVLAMAFQNDKKKMKILPTNMTYGLGWRQSYILPA